MMIRVAKLLLVAGVALFTSLVVFNNLTDFGTNYLFVRHVLQMDTIVNSGHVMGRAITSPILQLAFYLCIIAWEIATAILLWWGVVSLGRALRFPAHGFNTAKRIPALGLSLSLLMWLVAFLAVGGEWFLMWQSRTWNGQQTAVNDFAVVGIVLLLLLQPEV